MSSRDLIADLPLWPQPSRSSFGRGHLGDSAYRQERIARARCNKAILTIKELDRGNFTDKILEAEPWGKTGVFTSARGQAIKA